MIDFTLLMFDWDDSVAMVQTVRAIGTSQALRMAKVVSAARPNLAGYQLWRAGARIAQTYPLGVDAVRTVNPMTDARFSGVHTKEAVL